MSIIECIGSKKVSKADKAELIFQAMFYGRLHKQEAERFVETNEDLVREVLPLFKEAVHNATFT